MRRREMHNLQAVPVGTAAGWRMPLVPEQYDRSTNLTDAERAALVVVLAFQGGTPTLEPYFSSTQILARLTQPLQDIYTLWHAGPNTDYTYFLRWMYRRMA